ncbi:MAG: TlpA disulfide reductase family protein [Bacteroidota bacterium]
MTRKKTILNVLLILFVVSFFVTPLGYYGKLFLNRAFSFSPPVIEKAARAQLPDYNWRLKDEEWEFFNFQRSKGRVVLINFWASWRLPSEAELQSIQLLYDKYKGKMDFYIITNEDRPPVEEFMAEHQFTFPVTYLIIGDRAPVDIPKPPFSYLIDKQGFIVVKKSGIADWDTRKVHQLLDDLLQE